MIRNQSIRPQAKVAHYKVAHSTNKVAPSLTYKLAPSQSQPSQGRPLTLDRVAPNKVALYFIYNFIGVIGIRMVTYFI